MKTNWRGGIRFESAVTFVENYSRSVASDPYYVVTYDHRAFMYNKTGRPELALTDCEAALALSPHYVPSYLNKGTAYEKLGLYQEAIGRESECSAIGG